MKLKVITNSKKVLYVFHISGVTGKLVIDKTACDREWEDSIKDKEIGLILIDKFVYENLKHKVQEHERKLRFPLVLLIPSDEKERMKGDNLTQIIRETIGIKV
ncbi:MAG: V-type ATP synthase subunit F [bacterium]|nr:V-type ATP synthase subunit F [bacterium]